MDLIEILILKLLAILYLLTLFSQLGTQYTNYILELQAHLFLNLVRRSLSYSFEKLFSFITKIYEAGGELDKLNLLQRILLK